jgi:hypothetical protein
VAEIFRVLSDWIRGLIVWHGAGGRRRAGTYLTVNIGTDKTEINPVLIMCAMSCKERVTELKVKLVRNSHYSVSSYMASR